MKAIITTAIISFIALGNLNSQTNSDTTKLQPPFEAGITGGFALLYYSIEFSLRHNIKVTKKTSLFIKPSVGYALPTTSTDAFGDDVFYFGGTLGLSMKTSDGFIEFDAGLTHLSFLTDKNIKRPNILPSTSLGYKIERDEYALKFGVGIPNGLFITLYM